jgi:DNA-binding transcriptional LysR family regulator
MQLEALKIFGDVVRWSSFSRGAAENGISQSSASQAVHQLELRLGVKLIDRSKRPLVLTPHGQVFYEGCKDLVERYSELEARVKALGDERNVVGTVRVASIYSVGLAHLSAFVERFKLLYPRADVRLEYLHPARVLESVAGGLAELGLISFPRKWPDLTVIPWREEEMVVAVNPRHPLAALGEIEIAQLDGLSVVAFTPELAIRRAIDRYFRRHDVGLDVALEFDNIENIKRATSELPSGLALLPLPTLEHELATGSLRALKIRDHRIARPLAIIHRGAGSLGLPATRFLEILSARAAEPASPPAAKPTKSAAAAPVS